MSNTRINGVNYTYLPRLIVDDLIDRSGPTRVLINSASDFPDVIDSSVEYFINGVIDMGSRQITVPSTGISLAGV